MYGTASQARSHSKNSDVIECVGVMIESINAMVYVAYRQPNNPPKHRSTSKEFTTFLTKLDNHMSSLPTPTPTIYLVGDFNLPNADWESGDTLNSDASNTPDDPAEADQPAEPNDARRRVADRRKMVKALYELGLGHFLVQQIESTTHIKGNTLDLCFTNNSQAIHEIISTPCATEITDHHHIEIQIDLGSSETGVDDEEDDAPLTSADEWRGLNFFSQAVNWNGLISDIAAHNWESEFQNADPSQLHDRFSSTCLNIAKKHVPLRKSKQHNSPTPPHRRRLMRSRTQLRRRWNATPNEATKTDVLKRFTSIERKLRLSYAEQQESEETKAVANLKVNPKFFFSYAKKHAKSNDGIGPLRTEENSLTSLPRKMAELLSNQYKSAFSQPRHQDSQPFDIFPDNDQAPPHSTLDDIPCVEKDFADAMKELRFNAAAGPDGIPAILLYTNVLYCTI